MPIVIILVLLLFPSFVHAQTSSDLLSTTIDQGNQYRAAYSDYVRSKNQHLQYATAATRLDTISKTGQVLEKRNAWEIAYLRFLRQSLADSTNIANYSQTIVYLSMETQISNLTGQAGSFSGLDSFNKINTASANWENGLSQIDPLVAAAQMQIASGKLEHLQSDLLDKLQTISSSLGTPSASQKSTLDLIQSKYNASLNLSRGVDQKLTGFSSNYFSKSGLVSDLNLAKQNLLDGAKLLVELSQQTGK